MRRDFEQGIAWGEAKRQLFELVNTEIAPAREEYYRLLDDPAYIESVLRRGAERARAQSAPLLARVREAVGIRAMA